MAKKKELPIDSGEPIVPMTIVEPKTIVVTPTVVEDYIPQDIKGQTEEVVMFDEQQDLDAQSLALEKKFPLSKEDETEVALMKEIFKPSEEVAVVPMTKEEQVEVMYSFVKSQWEDFPPGGCHSSGTTYDPSLITLGLVIPHKNGVLARFMFDKIDNWSFEHTDNDKTKIRLIIEGKATYNE